ncbi:IS110 family transposase [Duganella sp. FT92W]|uniref:IS110 family transposase n=1 Tax=Pseudoduganella rivuli TaxID=2666085 RepID=A0A7X2LWS5_9BURK|nr:IS110 family transposase [Pseudoduganella rivuli]MRV76861.1 IS110 family transposase [Pseudoduganella rivuli]
MQTAQTHFTSIELILAVALELASNSWKVAIQDGQRAKASVHTVSAKEPLERLLQVLDAVSRMREKWGLPENIRIVFMYEAGQDGFWIARALTDRGFEAHVVNPSGIPVEKQAKRAKTDRLDAIMLVERLRSWLRGELSKMHMVHIPSPEAEAQRHLIRDRGELQKEINQHLDRIRKLLRTQGTWLQVNDSELEKLVTNQVRCYDGALLPAEMLSRFQREVERLKLARRQFDELNETIEQQLPEPVRERIATLQRLKAVGPVSARRLVLELFWRHFQNRKQVGACVGLCPMPYDSGKSKQDQGISKAGAAKVRALLIELAWGWLRHQPQSELATWFKHRTLGTGQNKRMRRVAIVAVARKLTIALWQYLEHGAIPAGAMLKAG